MHAPTTHRPSTHDDLPSHERDGQAVLHRPLNPTQEQAAWFGRALADAVNSGLEVDADMNIIRPYTTEELDRSLKNVQSNYDTGREEYITFHEDGTLPKWNYAMSAYCRIESLTMPTQKEQ